MVSGCARIEGLICDHIGWVQISFTIALAHSSSPEYAKTITIREGLHLAERFGYTNYTLKSDCKKWLFISFYPNQNITILQNIFIDKIFLLFIGSLLSDLLFVRMLIFQHIYQQHMLSLSTSPMFTWRYFPIISTVVQIDFI